jgi:hypothetical protein
MGAQDARFDKKIRDRSKNRGAHSRSGACHKNRAGCPNRALHSA